MYVIPRSTVTLPEDPVKEGHTFAGWYYGTQAEHEENCRAYDGAPIYEDTELHAHFNINRYTVTYDVAGGTPVNSMVLDWNTVAEKPTVSRTGYNFLGWYLSDGTEYSNQPIKEDTTLIAHWEIKTFTVTFYVGEEKHAELTVDYGTTLKELTEEAQAMNLQVMSLRASNGAPINIGENGLTEDVDVQAEVMTGADKVQNTIKNNWLTIALSVGGVIVLVVLISTLFSRKKKKAYRY
ncbi:InlB B-repeat-containing protein [Pumilibacter intestinalis]|uniref:InlB B-repeat-containing protein n=1 Tax=Pumilibacter intestinalis TaxID=2941511 RepID=UPI0020424104|nr:InlB B-repeat-containing protein [Pumilibacter intestinalis]